MVYTPHLRNIFVSFTLRHPHQAIRIIDMARDRHDRTYRVRQLPPHLDIHRVVAFLVTLHSSLGPSDNIQVHSLAGELGFLEPPLTNTATVSFANVPEIFDNDNTEWGLAADHLGLKAIISFDTHFIGFTALNEVDPALHHVEYVTSYFGIEG